MSRVVFPGVPHHVMQRGVRRNDVFHNEDDYLLYIDLLSGFCGKNGTEIWAYCLMTNHVHLIMVPSSEDGLRASLGETHRRFTLHVNRRENCRGHLWQERFRSFPMDEQYLLAAVRYVEMNPVRAKMVKQATDYPWSSAMAHHEGKDDKLVRVGPMLERVSNWQEYLDSALDEDTINALRMNTNTGRPAGSESFIEGLERKAGRVLRPLQRGRKRRNRK